ncbi:MAG: DMT family transporter [Blastochloris sp.]|nr:DMT family transporter [Blastochloris sp.]
MVIEWFWLGTMLLPVQLIWMTVILSGVFLALKPREAKGVSLGQGFNATGLAFGVGAALGQAGGAVLSRKAVALNQGVNLELDGLTSSFQRIQGGLLVALLFFCWFQWCRRSVNASERNGLTGVRTPGALGYCLLNALAGPVLGVGCYQWALSQTPSGIVLAVVATTPIVIIPIVWLLEGEKPDRWTLLGSVLAVAGVWGLLSC